ncbi:MAG: glycosyltransferase family 2 protein [Atribacterota bacterium]|nr:glycosyltransferase family 2 protein [Atribacterota bacterium]
MVTAPIAFFAYNRPEHTKRALESLSRNSEAQRSELFVFIDGPKTEQDKEKIEIVKSIIKSKEWCGKTSIYESKENHGCARQFIEGISWLCSTKGRIIVLEDDNLVSPFFLKFMNNALDIYATKEKVMDVTGYMYPVGCLNVESGFMRGGGDWGWATWQRAWTAFEPDGKKLLSKLSDKKTRYEFNYQNSYNYYSLLLNHVKGKIESWSVRWYASMFLKGGSALFPGKSLVQNIGFDSSGRYGSKTDKYNTPLYENPIREFPNTIEENEKMLSATIKYFKTNNSFFKKIKDKAISIMGL